MTRNNYLQLLCAFALLFLASRPLSAQNTPQDIKNDGPIRITFWSQTTTPGQNAQCRRVFYVTNTGTTALPLQYVSIQVPNGMVAEAPTNNTVWNAPGALLTPVAPAVPFTVQSPSFSPMYGIRFNAPANYSMAPGETRAFSISTPALTGINGCPWYTRVTVRVKPKTFYSVLTQQKKSLGGDDDAVVEYAEETETTDRGGNQQLSDLRISPNPAASGTYLDLSQWTGQDLRVRLFDLQGRLAQEWSLVANDSPEYLDLSEMANGLYLLQVIPDSEPAVTEKVVIQR